MLAFFISMIVLFAVAFIFVLAVDKVVSDALIAKIAKIAVGALALIVFVKAVAGVLGFAGGAAASTNPYGPAIFAIAVLVVLMVLYLIKWLLPALAAAFSFPEAVTSAIIYVVEIVALIGLIWVAAGALLGNEVPGYGAIMGHTPQISR